MGKKRGGVIRPRLTVAKLVPSAQERALSNHKTMTSEAILWSDPLLLGNVSLPFGDGKSLCRLLLWKKRCGSDSKLSG